MTSPKNPQHFSHTSRIPVSARFRWLGAGIRGCWFQLRSLASTTFFIQNAALTPVCFALMKIVALYALGNKFGSGLDATSIWIDAAIAGLWSTTTTAVGIIGYQRYLGTMQYLATSVISPSAVFLPVVASAALLGIIGFPLSLLTVAICAHHAMAVSGLQILGYFLAMLACVASASVLAGIFVLFRRATAYEPLILLPIWMLCGLVTSIDIFPMPVRVIAFLHPLTSAVWVAHASSFSPTVWLITALCVCLSIIFLYTASRMLRYAIKLATQDGSLNIL